MIGCCGKEREKFKFINGEIDKERLSIILDGIDFVDLNKGQLEAFKSKVSSCDCPCHLDGSIVRC